MQIINQAIIFGSMFTRDSGKVLDILKELTFGVTIGVNKGNTNLRLV